MKTLSKGNIAVAVLALWGATTALAADPFPSKPVRIVVTSAPGGQLDLTTRVVAKQMSEKLGQPIVVDNRAGAGGLVAIRSVKSAPADGYTLLAAVNTVAIQQAVNVDPGYDLVKDFAGVGTMTRSPYLLLAPATDPDKNVGDMLSRARTNPGKLSYGSAGIGSTSHLAAALFVQRAGVNLLHVPYKGNSAAWPDLVSGRVGMLMEPYGTAAGMIREGRVRVLGITSTKRLALLPDVPTIAEHVPTYSFYAWIGLLAPAGTPKEVVEKLSAALRGSLESQELKNRFRDEGAETMLMSPEEFTKFLRDESADMQKLVTELALPKQQ